MNFDPDIFDAVEIGDLESVKRYWSDQIDIDWQDNRGINLLMLAVYYKDRPIIDFLLSKNPNLELRNTKGENVFDIAEKNQSFEILELLLGKNRPEEKY